MNNDPYSSIEQTNQVHTLFIQINKNNIAYWNKDLDTSRNDSFEHQQQQNSFNRSNSFSQDQNNRQSSFHHDYVNQSLQIQSKIDRSLQLQSKMFEPMFQVQQMFDDHQIIKEQDHYVLKGEQNCYELKEQCNQSLNQSHQLEEDFSQNLPSQITITLHQQSFASKVLEEFDTYDTSIFSTSLKGFLNVTSQNYRPHIDYMKFLFSKLKEHGSKSIRDIKLYINFLQIRMKQEIESLKVIDNLQLTKFQMNNHELNMDEKAVMGYMISTTNQNKTQRKLFYSKMIQLHEGLLDTWKRIKQKREKRQKFIQQDIFGKLDRIQLQMQDMIRCCLLNEKQRAENKHISNYIRSESIYVKKDKYLQNKYLIEREKVFLSLLVDLNGKLITYMINMLTKEQIPICKSVRDAVIQYGQGYMQCYSKNHINLTKKISQLKQMQDDEELKEELANILFNFIPKQLYDIAQHIPNINSISHPLQTILQKFCNHLQNNIFMPTIELNYDFILYKNEAIWKNTSSFIHKEQKALDFESKEVLNVSNSFYASNKGNYLKMNNEDLKITIVLTSNFYLHLENQHKVATIYLQDVKFTKKGKEIIIVQKPKDLSSYFWSKKQLGRLQFESMGQLQFFASKISKALGKLMQTQ